MRKREKLEYGLFWSAGLIYGICLLLKVPWYDWLQYILAIGGTVLPVWAIHHFWGGGTGYFDTEEFQGHK